MKVGLIDDDRQFIDYFKQMCLPVLSELDDVEFMSFTTVIPYSELEGLDLLFLDIQIETDNGISYALDLRNQCQSRIPLVFMSSKNELVFDSMAAGPIYFIRKNNLKEDFQLFYKLYKDRYLKNPVIYIGQNIPIKINDIIYISAYGHDVTIQTLKKQFVFSGTMRKLLAQINNENFVQIQKSTTINLSKVNDVYSNTIILVDGSQFEVSRMYKQNFMNSYKVYLLK